MSNHIFIVAGDLSGEMHAARLAAALKRLQPGCRISALGGDHLEKTSDSFLENLVSFSAFGFTGPFKLYFRLRRVFNEKIRQAWSNDRPDKVVLVDYYGFNIHVAREAHRLGIPVYYYISPQVWASRPGRIRKLAKYVTKMLVILPFEEELYRRAGVDAVFVGHPLLDIVPEPAQKEPSARPVIGIFPGSRPSVLKKHLPLCDRVCALLREQMPCDIKVFGLENARPLYAQYSFPVVFDKGFEQRRSLDAAVTVSGTVCLENTLLGIPMAVFYKLSPLNYALARLVANVDSITMANILAGKTVVPEFIQDRATPENIAAAVLTLLRDRSAAGEMKDRLLLVRKQLGNPGVSDRAARIVLGPE